MTSIYRADHVVAHRDGRHVLIADGEVVVENDRIVAVGARSGRRADVVRELGRAVLMPGLIDLNALCDVDHLTLGSWATPQIAPGLMWSSEYFTHRRHHVFTARQRAAVRRYALAQLALRGITTFMLIGSEIHSAWAEDDDDLVAFADVAEEFGLRGFMGNAFRSGINATDMEGNPTILFDEDEGRRGFADALRFVEHLDERANPLLTGVLLPCRIETLTEELMTQVAQASRERDLLVRLHALQGLPERASVLDLHGATPMDLLDRTGLLNERLLIPHMVYTDAHPDIDGDATDLARLAQAGVTLVHCPLTSFRLGQALHSFDAYREAGIRICLGTDSFPPDLIRGIDLGMHLSRLIEGRHDAGSLAHFIEAATLGGAAALRRPDLGRIEVGAQADLAAYDLSGLRRGVLDDPLRTLVLGGTAECSTLTVVAGREIMLGGDLLGVDMPALEREGQVLFDTMKNAYPERDYAGRSVDELFPPTFPS